MQHSATGQLPTSSKLPERKEQEQAQAQAKKGPTYSSIQRHVPRQAPPLSSSFLSLFSTCKQQVTAILKLSTRLGITISRRCSELALRLFTSDTWKPFLNFGHAFFFFFRWRNRYSTLKRKKKKKQISFPLITLRFFLKIPRCTLLFNFVLKALEIVK